jgi:hypothetical protein
LAVPMQQSNIEYEVEFQWPFPNTRKVKNRISWA